MHRHGYKGRKFGRERDERKALLRGLECALIEHLSITTTLARAKEMRSSTEKLITRAKKNTLANRRLIMSRLGSDAPQIKRDSGYLCIERAGFRQGDHAELGTISFVDEIDLSKKPEKPAAKKAEKEDK